MESNTHVMHSAILNAIIKLTESDKEAVINAFENSMSHMMCGHEFCESVGVMLAKFVEDEDWQGLSNFLDHEHLEEV